METLTGSTVVVTAGRFWVVSHRGIDAMVEDRFGGILDAARHGGEIGAR